MTFEQAEARDTVEVNGAEPPIVGVFCQRIVFVEYWHAGVLVEPVNSAHLRFDDHWYRLYIDSGVVFWRPSIKEPEGYGMPELDGECRTNDITNRFGNQRLVGIAYALATHRSRGNA